jgi:lipoic acid synthetase
VAEAAGKLGLEHVVVTSVTRDDLEDGGASHFAHTISWVRKLNPGASMEVLIPDFAGRMESLVKVVEAGPEVLNHNLETVERLYPVVRKGADYRRSLALLEKAKSLSPSLITKSGLMVGLGERWDELKCTFGALAAVGCDILTLGQYLRPTRDNLEVSHFYTPEEFAALEELAESYGIPEVVSAPLVRSSYRARESMEKMVH